MDRDPKAFLWDAFGSAEAILRFIEAGGLADYVEDRMLRSAVEREFEIIGEALNQLAKSAPDLAARISDLRHIVAFRNLLIHGYASVKHERVWRIAREDLPRLRTQIENLLAALPNGLQ